MKVYVMTDQLVLDGDDSGIFTHAYSDKAEADKAFKLWVKEEKEACVKDGWRIYTDTDTVFEAFAEGDWPMNHSCAYIEEFDI
jgi:hypothetical protein